MARVYKSIYVEEEFADKADILLQAAKDTYPSWGIDFDTTWDKDKSGEDEDGSYTS